MTDETSGDPTGPTEPAEPLIRITRGRPTAEELAALVVVLTAARPARESATTTSTGWGAYWRGLNTPPRPGPGGPAR